jgi:hypothetical protein
LFQEKYIHDLLDCASLTDHRTAETLMELNVHLVATEGEPLVDPTRYHHIVGSLVYLGVTRPDISYSVHIPSQFISAPTQIHYSHLFVSSVIFVGLSLVACSFHALVLYSSRYIVMLLGLVIPLTAIVEHACQRFLLPQLSYLLMCHLPLWRCHLLLLLRPPLRLVPLLISFLDMVNAYVDHLTVTLLQLSLPLLCLSQLLITMLFFIRNDST